MERQTKNFKGDEGCMPAVETVLLNAIGYSTENIVIDFLIGGEGFDYTKKNIADNCRISRPTVYSILPKLLKDGVVKPTRKIGNTQLYALNSQNERVKALIKLEEILLKKSFEEMEEKYKPKAKAAKARA